MTNINIHPAQCPPGYILVPYTFLKRDKRSGKEQIEGETNHDCFSNCPIKTNYECISIRPISVKTFLDIKIEVNKALNLPYSTEVSLDPLDEGDYEEGFRFGPSIHVEIETEDYFFGISFNCFRSFNAYAWGKNCCEWD